MSTTIITGATSGLGLATTRLLASQRPEESFIITSRKLASAQKVANAFTNMTPMALDVSDPDSIKQFTENVKKQNVLISGIIANAGAQFTKPTTNKQGVEATFATNVIGQYRLVTSMQPLLSSDAKVILVSSDTHDRHKFTGMPNPQYLAPATLADEPKSSAEMKHSSDTNLGQIRYTTSKLAVIYLVHALVKHDPKHTYISFNPGLMPGKDSGLARNYAPAAK
ncbi:hypothetical protein AYR62_15400 [Secundilactobacillus paracollinoides]|uniref:Oxidoreductase n=1 Tax=Secundilactobacillus paracollinoides TaxID=240427 RepID=A0A1B2IW02_9LACO|nr:SDR family NAD(P)-dependent oxidoreductase [Secundilactobacillus paracollinoides]ANZ60394.1 hypothetical protein AYR61_02875 [Secundilactobacillus paracollinoides]ANZ65325.1 hypothetical protein AYR62_15400 [Secundilactobacillus paracollinoides]ANZ66223.1 hypothetical protein AYR63_03080 [Secundilactobacillus paracollinoides]KRL75024.1 hypothetical protein FC17_GL002919 [Secundilactobacillus paracollinoides DSM 15502 = JCM 11969]